jgi:UDP:flavonoid glycosyltransferase YjiC (YdhE family)
VTLLVISPDYASHLFPLATLATAWRDAGERVVVASGPATADIVAAFGFERVNLQLGRGSNPGVIRAEDQPTGEDEALRGFFDATRVGMIETLTFQARARSTDLLWNPVQTARAVQRIVDEVDPQQIIVDHLAFSARLGLVSGRHRHADVVLGHPSALPVAGEVYGFPPHWPTAFHPEVRQTEQLRALCESVRDSFTAQWNEALAQLDPLAPPTADAFAESGDLLFLNYPAELHDDARTALFPPHAFIGSAVREEAPHAEVDAWLAESQKPVVYVSFGSFLSVRGDVLAEVAEALRGLDVRAAIATGSSDPAELGRIPGDWLVRGFLPQVTLLRRSSLAVSHGGNNSITEAMTAAVPMLLLPFSTDQFAGAAAVEDAGFGIALDPNTVTAADLSDSARRLLALGGAGRAALDRLGASLTGYPGARRAFDALMPSIAGEWLQR